MKRIIFIMLILCTVFLYGCGEKDALDLPGRPVRFEEADYENPHNKGETYKSITYDGRTYIPYGRMNSELDEREIDYCIGYMFLEEDPSDTGCRVYTLKEDTKHNYLMVYYTDQRSLPTFLRAVDTRDKKIETPAYIDRTQQSFWN